MDPYFEILEVNYYEKKKGELSYSIAKRLLTSPLDYISWLTAEREPVTKALNYGRAFDILLLEPERSEDVVVFPDVDKRTKKGRELVEEFEAANTGKCILSQDEYANIQAMLASLSSDAHRHIKNVLDNTAKQLEMHYVLDGIQCKSRLDAYCEGDGVIYDVKTTSVIPTLEAWRRECWKYNYMLQAAFYFAACDAELLPATRFCWVIAEKSAPFHWVMYHVDRNSKYVEAAEQKMLEAVALMKNCLAEDCWPGLQSCNLYDD